MNQLARDCGPGRMSQKRRSHIAEKYERHHQKNALDSLIRSFDDQPPNSDGGYRDREVAGDAEQFHRRGDAHEL